MKKSCLALLISTVILITGCEDKINTQKLLDAEKTIMQLESQLRASQAEIEQAKKRFPALNVEIEALFNKSEHVELTQAQKEDYSLESSEVRVFASIPKTNVQWLDQLLLTQFLQFILHIEAGNEGLLNSQQVLSKQDEISPETAVQHLQQVYDTLIENIKEFPVIGMHSSLESQYLGQRNHLVSFSMRVDEYMGGAHGMYMTHYVNIDINKRKVLTLNELINTKQREKLKALLWQTYREQRVDENGQYNGFTTPEEFRVSENFYFGPNGIVFVYPPYELGSFAEGEIELELNWFMANEMLNLDYQRTPKDGFNQNSTAM
ncbi:RsiV family protein [Bibersteinia trehalosi]|uniref:RsiV family protein n=1 Tax=Bibersteinia trehalosi TaxID=47735 RepID=UPI003D266109